MSEHGLKCVHELATLRATHNLRGMVIIGMGGITTPPDAFSYIQSGADIVQAATGFITNPNFGIEVRQYMDKVLPPYRHTAEQDRQAATANWGEAMVRLLDEQPEDKHTVQMCLDVSSQELLKWYVNNKQTSALGPRRSSIPSAADFYARLVTELGKRSQK